MHSPKYCELMCKDMSTQVNSTVLQEAAYTFFYLKLFAKRAATNDETSRGPPFQHSNACCHASNSSGCLRKFSSYSPLWSTKWPKDGCISKVSTHVCKNGFWPWCWTKKCQSPGSARKVAHATASFGGSWDEDLLLFLWHSHKSKLWAVWIQDLPYLNIELQKSWSLDVLLIVWVHVVLETFAQC